MRNDHQTAQLLSMGPVKHILERISESAANDRSCALHVLCRNNHYTYGTCVYVFCMFSIHRAIMIIVYAYCTCVFIRTHNLLHYR